MKELRTVTLVTLLGCLLSLAQTELQKVQNANCQRCSGEFLLTHTLSQGQGRAASLGPSLCISEISPALRAVFRALKDGQQGLLHTWAPRSSRPAWISSDAHAGELRFQLSPLPGWLPITPLFTGWFSLSVFL